jgi:hypothetical protein
MRFEIFAIFNELDILELRLRKVPIDHTFPKCVQENMAALAEKGLLHLPLI